MLLCMLNGRAIIISYALEASQHLPQGHVTTAAQCAAGRAGGAALGGGGGFDQWQRIPGALTAKA